MICWGGFTEGRLHLESMDDHFGGRNERHVPALFLTRKEARKQFEDVRKVEIRLVETGRKTA